MDYQVRKTFESIESAHEFVRLLSEAVVEAMQDIDADIERELATSKATRRLDALRIVLYSLEKLELHMHKSGQILNDLRTLRRLVFEERLGCTKFHLDQSPARTALSRRRSHAGYTSPMLRPSSVNT